MGAAQVGLSSQTELGDNRPVARRVLAHEVSQQTSPLADQLQQTSTRGMVLVVLAEVIGQPAYALRKEGHLHFGRACIARLVCEVSDDLLFGGAIQHVPAGPSRSFSALFCCRPLYTGPRRRGTGRARGPRVPGRQGRTACALTPSRLGARLGGHAAEPPVRW